VILARVIGNVVASRKDDGLSGHRLLLLQPVAPDGTPNAKPLVDVFYVRAREAPLAFLPHEPPVDATVVGIVDHVNVPKTW
jgi:ethanolamine utilization protein EutN